MPAMMRRYLAKILCFVVGFCLLQCPAQPAEQTPRTYLLRLERMRPHEDVCVLVNDDGTFHRERLLINKIEISEGLLEHQKFDETKQTVDASDLAHLSQSDILDPLVGSGLDEVFLSIQRRPGEWQNLKFSSLESRKPYQQSLDRLLKLLDELGNVKGRHLTEDSGRNNCLPQADIKLQDRTPHAAPAIPAVPPSQTLLLRYVAEQTGGRKIQKECTVIYADQRFHTERMTQYAGQNQPQSSIFEDAIPSEAIGTLRQLLDDPRLRDKKTGEPPSGVVISELSWFSLDIQRGDQTQRLSFWKYQSAFGVGSAGITDYHDNGVGLLKPLQHWLQANIDQKKLAPLANAHPNSCKDSTLP
jgi:hypothetical protein